MCPVRSVQRVTLCSMRNGCSRDLLDPAHLIRDFDVVWLEVRGVCPWLL